MADMNGAEGGDRPVVELFVKAAVDKMKNGGCPICHRYFLMFYILRERGLVDLVVTTFLPESPPKEVLEFSNGKHFPLVKVHRGVDSRGKDISGMECDSVDEIEALLDKFDCDEMRSGKESRAEAEAEKSFEDLYGKFSQFLKTGGDVSALVRVLDRIEGYLRSSETKFMLGDQLSRADCYLLPSLQHIRVAGKAYKNFEIPTELTHLWRYLKHSYETDAFQESCPADREIITHYNLKATNEPQINAPKSQLLGEDRTFSIPPSVRNQGVPSINYGMSFFHQSKPFINQSMPSINQSVPSLKQCKPSFNQCKPSVNHSKPSSSLQGMPFIHYDVPYTLQGVSLSADNLGMPIAQSHQ